MNEHAFRYGENNRGFGMITLPDSVDNAPVVVILNAGLLHRAEPFRLGVQAARRLATAGYISIRVDLSGKGDTRLRAGLSNRESVALDWKWISESIDRQFGKRTILIMGLCSGADNAIKLTANSHNTRGLILLDPVAKRDRGFKSRQFVAKITNIHRWRNLPIRVFKRLKKVVDLNNGHELLASLRDEPNELDILNCFTALKNRKGRALAFFTGSTTNYYNLEGQFAKTLPVDMDGSVVEKFWPDVEHIYPVQCHRNRLLSEIELWAISNLSHFKEGF
jgi:hypothetical protein